MEDNTLLKKSIDEELREAIVKLLWISDKYLIDQRYDHAYNSLKALFNKIRPFKFKYKDELMGLTEVLDEYLASLGAQPVDAYHKLKLEEDSVAFKDLVDSFSQYIPFALKELKLYFDVAENLMDDDQFCFNRTFNMDESLIVDKKKELSVLSVEELMGHMDSKMVNRIYSRHRIKSVVKQTRTV